MNTVLINNRYQILQIIGKGGFGETFLAVDTHLPSGRKCVLKQLKPMNQDPGIQQAIKERFQREAAILEELGQNNPQIPSLYAYFVENGSYYLVQEWIPGMTLRQKQQQQGRLPATEVRDILIDLLPVLDYIHSQRIIHRDLKPENIIIRQNDQKPVLIDFGAVKEAMATVMVGNAAQPSVSMAIGTPGFMASEQAAGRPVYSSDLYSLGLMAIYLLTGKNPQDLANDLYTGEIIWRDQVPNLDLQLASIIEKAVRFHPRDRYTTAKEMLTALQGTRENVSQLATVAVAPGQGQLSTMVAAPAKGNQGKVAVSRANSESKSKGKGCFSWLLSFLLFMGITTGAFALGFVLFFDNKDHKSPSKSKSDQETPAETVNPTEQTFPETPIPGTPAPAVTTPATTSSASSQASSSSTEATSSQPPETAPPSNATSSQPPETAPPINATSPQPPETAPPSNATSSQPPETAPPSNATSSQPPETAPPSNATSSQPPETAPSTIEPQQPQTPTGN